MLAGFVPASESYRCSDDRWGGEFDPFVAFAKGLASSLKELFLGLEDVFIYGE